MVVMESDRHFSRLHLSLCLRRSPWGDATWIMVEGVLRLGLLLVAFHLRSGLPPASEEQGLLALISSPFHIFISLHPSPVSRACSFSWAEDRIPILLLLCWSK